MRALRKIVIAIVLTSDMGEKTVSVLAHKYLLPLTVKFGFRILMYPQKYPRSKLCTVR